MESTVTLSYANVNWCCKAIGRQNIIVSCWDDRSYTMEHKQSKRA